jgi:hypothetical protein
VVRKPAAGFAMGVLDSGVHNLYTSRTQPVHRIG